MTNLAAKVCVVAVLLACTAAFRLGSLSCCPKSYVFDRDTLRCVCPPSAQYRDASGQCIACNAPSWWDENALVCHKCPKGQSENSKGVCVCPWETPSWNGSVCSACPEDKPVWNGHTCVACPANTHFSASAKTCIVCPPGLEYRPDIRECKIIGE